MRVNKLVTALVLLMGLPGMVAGQSAGTVARHFLPGSLPLVAWSAGFDSRQGPPAGAQGSSKLPSAVQGRVFDPAGSSVPKAQITVIAGDGSTHAVKGDRAGTFVLGGLPAGPALLVVSAPGFATYRQSLELRGAKLALNVHLALARSQQVVSVNAEAATVNLQPTDRAAAIIVSGKGLQALATDPTELATDLQALAGPSVGGGGGTVYINGFTRGDIPPKADIQSIEVNNDPYSPKFARLGYGRIEIHTKPGSQNLHGQVSYDGNRSNWNSLDPFLAAHGSRPPSYSSNIFGASAGGPLGKKPISWLLSFERRDINAVSVINAQILNAAGAPETLVSSVPSPDRRTAITPEMDFQLSPTQTLWMHYEYLQYAHNDSGVGGESLPSQAQNTSTHRHNLQIADTEIVSPVVVNVLSYQWLHHAEDNASLDQTPSLDVLGAFAGGGNPAGNYRNWETHNSLRDDLTMQNGNHQWELGGETADVSRSESDMTNFNGDFIFTSLASYQATLGGLQKGETMTELQAQGIGPSQFAMTVGQPRAHINRLDAAAYAQDSWHARPHLMLTYGVRLQTENVLTDKDAWAPRLGVAWGLGRARTTVVRGGFGLFYGSFDDDQMIIAAHRNGSNERAYVVNRPRFYPNLPSAAALAAEPASYPSVYRYSPTLHAPTMATASASVEHQFGGAASISVSYRYSHADGEFLTNDVNAPLPGTYHPAVPTSGVRPYGDTAGNIYEYQSAGIFRQHQWTANFRLHPGSKLSLSGYYSFNHAYGDSQGADSFPTDPWNLMADYGPSPWNVRQRFFVEGSLTLPWGISADPFLVAQSGSPFSITLGEDLYGTGQQNARPAFAGPNTPAADVVRTPYGNFNVAPSTTGAIIPPNTATGPAAFSVNLRLLKSFRLGETAGQKKSPYRLQLGVEARNLFNNVNLSAPLGNLLSSRFGQSVGLRGGEYSAGAANRRLDLVATFSF